MTAPTRRRTRAREIAMQILFQVDLRGPEFLSEFGKTIDELCSDECQGEADVSEFASRLVTGTIEQRDAIDVRLQAVTRNWDLRRMANVDRNVLRMAIYELIHCDDVPPKVTINEAIDLAKKYSTANSGGFCNGILDRVRIDLERERAEPASRPAEPAAAPDAAPADDLEANGSDSLSMDSGGADA